MPPASLQLTYEFTPRVYGGLGRHVSSLAHALTHRGAVVHVATLGDGVLPTADASGGVVVHRTAPVPAVDPSGSWLAAILAFDTVLPHAAAAAGDSCDVVHAHDWLTARTSVALGAELPLVVTVHATERGRHQGWLPNATSRFVDAVERWQATAARQVIVCSQAMRTAVIDQWALDPARISVVPNGVGRQASPRDPEPGRVLFAGRLEHEKGGQVLLGAAARLRRRGLPLTVVFAGTGSAEQDWRRLAAELGLGSDALFVGRLAWERLALEYARAAVVVVPSLYEPFGMVAAEAIAAGAPVLASDTGGLREVVADGGILVAPGDAAGLADALRHLLESSGARRRVENAARRRAAQLWSWEQTADATLTVYEKATDRSAVWTG